ncbi:hypothetical protein E3Q22_00467 [Wallemia mellicola]|uniref:Histone acetyltransferase n=1 Tax=Wallemia mellicola TaxID=1708541 RepID=A0A4T0MG37_9BASI|nr:hypothetical protein E3Q22_00467 [Wallemia mellicola]TIC04394.1 hypothetical protein E3Q17_00456 [Wallemia mellicola]
MANEEQRNNLWNYLGFSSDLGIGGSRSNYTLTSEHTVGTGLPTLQGTQQQNVIERHYNNHQPHYPTSQQNSSDSDASGEFDDSLYDQESRNLRENRIKNDFGGAISPAYINDTLNQRTKRDKQGSNPKVNSNGHSLRCAYCAGDYDLNFKTNKPETMITCGQCQSSAHPTCLHFTPTLTQNTLSYNWSCVDCKGCEVCKNKGNEDDIIFCDLCDRGWHMHCLNPPMNEPPAGDFACPICLHAGKTLSMQQPAQALPQQQQQHQQPHAYSQHQQHQPYPNAIQANSGANIPLHSPLTSYDFHPPPPLIGNLPTPQQSATILNASKAMLMGRPAPPLFPNFSPIVPAAPKQSKGRGRPRKILPNGPLGVPMTLEEREREKAMIREEKAKAREERARLKELERERDKDKPKNPVGRPPGPRASLSAPKRVSTFIVIDSDEDKMLEDRVQNEQQQGVNQSDDRQQQSVEMHQGEQPMEGVETAPAAGVNTSALPINKSENQEKKVPQGQAQAEPEENDNDDLFGGVLDPYEAQVTYSTPQKDDKERFEIARQKADMKLQIKPKKQQQFLSANPSTPQAEEHKSKSPPIKFLRFGNYEIQTWYAAPYPEEYTNLPSGRMFICEWCLSYRKSEFQMSRHTLKCKYRYPPGDEIYRNENVSIFEVDGRKNRIYCQNLCLLAKMFLDHKTLYYDVEPFLFYIITEHTANGEEFVGYFSKEKRSGMGYNLSCIMTLPIRQRKGWGMFAIDFSYLLSRKEGKIGTPERPLSKLGFLSYKRYWTTAIYKALLSTEQPHTLGQLSELTGMTIPDVTFTLRQNHLIHSVIVGDEKDYVNENNTYRTRTNKPHLEEHPERANNDDPTSVPVPAPNTYKITYNKNTLEAYLAKDAAKDYVRLAQDKLRWQPFITHQSQLPQSTTNEKTEEDKENKSIAKDVNMIENDQGSDKQDEKLHENDEQNAGIIKNNNQDTQVAV